ncbi:hypothetical protein [Microbacterium sp. 179-I 3D4 NHS]|uniref:hypothetical protein n=1 Tax=Microbacterium sp. 179-I 3D4 NHS TaxID=3142381 RepID=UPI00399EFF79
MTLATVQHQLSTPDGFAKAVSARSATFGIGLTSLLLGLGGIAMNLFQLGSASDWSWRLMFRYFFDAQAIEFSGSRAGRAEVWRFLYVYGPLVLIPLGIILLVVHVATRRSAGAALFADFQARGWVGKQRYTGLKVKNGNNDVDTVFISHPSIPDETFDSIALQYQTQISALDKKALKAAAAAAVKAGALKGTSAAALAPGLPAEVTVAPVQGKGEFAVVVPPAPGTTGKYRVLPLKG